MSPKELIPPRVRRRFQDSYSSDAVLRQIETDFVDAGLESSPLPPNTHVGGARRTLVEEFYQHIDWTDPDDVARVLSAWESHLLRLEESGNTEEVAALRRVLKSARYDYNGGNITGRAGLPESTAAEERRDEGQDLWEPDHFRLFLSHVSGFKSKVALLRKELRKFGIDGFVAHEDIKPSREWQDEIERALRSMDALTALLSEGFRESSWTDQEVGFALGRGIPVVAVIRDLDPYGFIGKRQGIIGRNKNVPEVAEALFQTLLLDPVSRDRMRATLVLRLASSGSWEASRRNLALLRQTPGLNEGERHLLERAYLENKELHFSFGLRDGLGSLIGRELPEIQPSTGS